MRSLRIGLTFGLMTGMLFGVWGCDDDDDGEVRPDVVAPAAISDLSIDGIAAHSATLSWTAPGDDSTQGTASAYSIRHAPDAITDVTWEDATPVPDPLAPLAAGTQQETTVQDLRSEWIYHFAIRARDDAGNWSPLSNVVFDTTLSEEPGADTTAPAPITDLRLEILDQTRVGLVWTAPGDDGDQGRATTYDVAYATQSLSEATWDAATRPDDIPVPEQAGNDQAILITGLEPGTVYYFGVKTADEVPNWSELSNVVLAATLVPTGEPTRLTQAGARRPSVSGDGAWIAFQLPDSSIAVCARNQPSEYDTLTSFGREPHWSPVEDRIAFRSEDGLYVVDPHTKDVTLVRAGGENRTPAWSPDGTEIVVGEEDRLMAISYPDGQPEAIPCAEPDLAPCDGEHPTYSPDGAWVAFEDGHEIFKVARDGGTAEIAVDDLGDVMSPAWSPDGEYIAFSRHSEFEGWEIWVIDADGVDAGLWQLTSTEEYQDLYPTWTPDSRAIVFDSTRGPVPERNLWVIGFDPDR